MAKKKTRHADDEISFERSFQDLQQIVTRLEEGQLTLGESLKSYEQGIQRLKECYHALNQAENKIRTLTRLDANGNLDLADFNDDSSQSSNAAPGARQSRKRSKQNSPVEEEGLF